jgi:hypothetical protein
MYRPSRERISPRNPTFFRGVVFRLSNILLGGAFGLFWVVYTQVTGKALPMPMFWSCLGVFLAAACFGAWREQLHEGEKYRSARPDFQYDPDGSEISVDYGLSSEGTLRWSADHPKVRLVMRLRFTNRGPGTAFDPVRAIYGCWINDDNPEVFVDTGDSVGRTNSGERIHATIRAWHLIGSFDGKPVVGDAQTLVLLTEISSRANSRTGPQCINDPIWLTWYPGNNNQLAWATPNDVAEAAKLIGTFKELRKRPSQNAN